MRSLLYLIIPIALVSCSGPRSLYEMNIENIVAGEEVAFTNLSKNGEQYEWNFGDGVISNETSPKHKYYQSGRYTVTLKTTSGDKSSLKQKEIVVSPPEECLVLMKTDLGNMVFRLFDDTPFHRDNFVKLVEEGYYDGLLFHRVIQDFMIQGGDPQSKKARQGQMLGSGGPGYTIPAEILPEHVHVKGALAAARKSDVVNPKKESSGSQFYIVDGRKVDEMHMSKLSEARGINYTEEQMQAYLKYGGTPHLDGEYTVFGEVVEGLDVVDVISDIQTARGDRPKEDIKMEMILIK